MSDRFPSTRDDTPAYLARYLSRRQGGGGDASTVPEFEQAPPYLVQARLRAAERALLERAEPDAPPERTEAYARVTVSPREIVPPEPFRQRLALTTDVRLIRHGETQGYSADGGLTPLGRWQAHRKGQDLARGVKDGMTIRLLHAPTARARETAEGVHEGLTQAMARYGIAATVEAPRADVHFRNFQVWADGHEQDPTQAFQRYDEVLEGYERRMTGDRPGWLTEMDRFWSIQLAGGDPITHWLTNPLQFFEPAALVVRRFWRGMVEAVREGPEANLRVFVCSHSGPIRAVAAAAVGHDPGEPYNVEDVRIRVYADLEHAVVTYRGRGVEIEIPTATTPSWICDETGG